MAFNIENCIELWQNAGSKPYEVLIEEGVYNEFLSFLESSLYDIDENQNSDCIYRGMFDNYYKVGELISFDNPTSWSENEVVASRFKDSKGCILVLSPTQLIKGYKIPYNKFYEEEEVILTPLQLRVNKVDDDKVYVDIVS